MILRRLTKHVEDQNWFAVGVDFLIVVVGVLLAIQVTNWNERRQDQIAYNDSVIRLVEELRVNDRNVKNAKDVTVDGLKMVNTAANSLKACQTGPEVLESINDGLNEIQTVIALELRFEVISALTTDPRLIAQQSEDMKQLFNDINRLSTRIDQWASIVQNIMNNMAHERHALVSYAPMEINDLDAIVTQGSFGSYFRKRELDVPLTEACKDPTLLGLFAEWEAGTTYIILQINAYREHLTSWLETLGHPLENTQ
jgi:hypothetical protein